MKNIIFVAGARPNFAKVVPVLKEINKSYSIKFNPVLVHTGQHYDFNMSIIFFEQFGISLTPVCFNIGSGTHAQQTAAVMTKFEEYLARSPKVDFIVVVGDVNSSMAAALVAAKANITIVHIEAGLRSFDRTMPEEINRMIIDSVSTIFFTTEPSADANLISEGHNTNIYRVGNVMIDTLKSNLKASRKLDIYERYGLQRGKYILMTLHRPSNTDTKEKLGSIINIMDKIAKKSAVLFLVHPRTQKRMGQFKINPKYIICEEPLGYLETINLMENARLVVTDSGGIQEETTFLGIPCVTLRRNTERPITVSCGTNIIAGNEDNYEQTILESLTKVKQTVNIPLWDGKASERIMRILDKYEG